MDVSKKDWKLFQERIGSWQEDYIDRLNHEYIDLLSSSEPASIKFWALEKRIKQDRKKPGVIIEMTKKEVPYHLIQLMRDEVITEADLEGFSEELVGHVKRVLE